MVRKEIVNLNVYKSCGPDEINPRLLIELVDCISKLIALLLNKAMENGEIPNDWKRANVSPIYQKGPRNRAENYRTVSLTSIICKLMEYFVKKAVMNHIIEEKLLSCKQWIYKWKVNNNSTTQLQLLMEAS